MKCGRAAALALVVAASQPPPRIYVGDELLPVLSEPRMLNVVSGSLATPEPLKWHWEYVHPGPTDWLRFRIVVRNAPAGVRWFIDLFDAAVGGARVDRVGPDDFAPIEAVRPPLLQRLPTAAPDEARGAWTKLVESAQARLELYADGEVGAMSVAVERCHFEFAAPAGKAIVGADDRQDLVVAYGREHRYYRWSAPIGLLLFQRLSDGRDTNCTGFLVAPLLFVTNHHCVSAAAQLRTATVEFGVESAPVSPPVRAAIASIVYTNPGLDTSVLRLASAPSVLPAVFADRAPAAGDALVLIQHPGRRPKTIAVKDCRVVAAEVEALVAGTRTDFTHACDSEGGSSGAPLLDEATGRIVGLHHLALADPRSRDYLNFGVRAPALVEALRGVLPAAVGAGAAGRARSW